MILFLFSSSSRVEQKRVHPTTFSIMQLAKPGGRGGVVGSLERGMVEVEAVCMRKLVRMRGWKKE